MASAEALVCFKNSLKAFKDNVTRDFTIVQGLLTNISRYPKERLTTSCISSLISVKERLQLQLDRLKDNIIRVSKALDVEAFIPFCKDFEKGNKKETSQIWRGRMTERGKTQSN